MNDAQIVGWGHTVFGRSGQADTAALMAEVVPLALDHAGIGPEDVDGIFVGVYNNGFSQQDFQASLVAMGDPRFAATPATRYENACATGSAALYGALDFIAAGRGRIALVVGAEKMTATPTERVGEILLSASYHREEADVAGGFAGLFGRIAEAYFQRFGDVSDALALIASKNHAHGLANPYAHLRRNFGYAFCNTVSDKNPLVAGPLRRTDCSLVSDGAAAIVLADPQTAAGMRRAIGFRARAQANDLLALSGRDVLAFSGAKRAWSEALRAAGLTLEDLSLVETHDCFTIAELLEYEAMGLAAPGRGADVIRDGLTLRGGRLPVNLSGGLKSKGHPIGATGVSQHVMAAMQLAGEAGDMQLAGATLAGVFNMGGAAVANYCSVLERLR